PASRSRSTRPGPRRWRWPTNSSTVRGRIRSASGARADGGVAAGARGNSSGCRDMAYDASTRRAHWNTHGARGTRSWAAKVVMGRIRTVGLVVKRDRARVRRLAERVVRALRRRGVAVLADADAPLPGVPARPKAALAEEADLIVVLGGDGTLLSVA